MQARNFTVSLEHVRSFVTKQTAPIRPLTLLIGENSSGKSTFLAAVACMFSQDAFPVSPPFNEPPFNLGSFATIASNKGGRYGRDETFSLGFQVAGTEVLAVYGRGTGYPQLQRYSISRDDALLEVRQGNEKWTLAWKVPGGEIQEHTFRTNDEPFPLKHTPTILQYWHLRDLMMKLNRGQDLDQLKHLIPTSQSPFESVLALAPIRTKPKRTYDEMSEEYSPEGDHIPRLLARLLTQATESAEAHAVHEALREFGAESGLFRDVSVKPLGKDPEAPFQLRLRLGGPPVNLMDVGYGISQALPVIVQCALRRGRHAILVQQPEVHLHPRAQAALGTFFVNLARKGNQTFLVETHSDHLVDRVRLEVAKGTIDADRVQLLYFDKPETETTIHALRLDAQGNVLDAPETYRSFFMREELRLLGVNADD
jgi:hypothetical protein